MSYDFSTLNDKDLETLSRDILSKDLGISFQSFKMGADKGIDLRYASNSYENEIIVQVKHYLGSGISKLKSDLKKKEAQKIKALNPKRYIFVTSLSLSPKNKEEIKAVFSPYILSTNDILGKNELNSSLRKNPEIEQAHFKLWLSNTNILNLILHNSLKGRSEFFEEKIRKQIKIFVPSKTHNESVKILNKNHFILITGAPGVGKSTLANMLSYQLLAENFELVYIREITEAENLYISGKKQIFYFDDFLGSITLDLMSSRNADTAIVQFIERIKSDKFKRLILTCRTTILNQAKQKSDKIGNSGIDSSNYEVNIQSYRNIDKAKILYNHIYFSNLSEELKSTFFQNRFYWKVISHKNYNPRIIEFITDIDRLQTQIDYPEEIVEILNNPSRIWEQSYSIQISQNSRFLLSTLFSLGGKYIVHEKKLKLAFEERIKDEVMNNNWTKSANDFNKAIIELIGGFISKKHRVEPQFTTPEYGFLNPSIADFLCYFLTNNIDEYFSILNSAIYFEQFSERISNYHNYEEGKVHFGSKENYKKLHSIFINRLPYLEGVGAMRDLNLAVILIRLFEWGDIRERIVEIMDNFRPYSLSWDDSDNLIEILDYIAKNDLFFDFSFEIEELLILLSQEIKYSNQIYAFSDFILRHSIFIDLIKDSKDTNTSFYESIKTNIDSAWTKFYEDFINNASLINNVQSESNLTRLIDERRNLAKKINEGLNLEISPIINTFKFDYAAQLKKNQIINSENEVTIKNIEEDHEEVDETLAINRLFDSGEDELPF